VVSVLDKKDVLVIVVALIGAFALIFQPIIYNIYESSQSHPKVEAYVQCDSTSRSIQDGNWYQLDFKVKNVGEQTAVLRSVQIEVINYSVDYNPLLKRGLSSTKEENNKISYQIKNFGWGQASNVSITGTNVYEVIFFSQPNSEFINSSNKRFYEESELTKKLGIKFNETLWIGNISAGDSVDIQHGLADDVAIHSINDSNLDALFNNNFTDYSFYDRIDYHDFDGNKKTKYVAYAISELNGSFYGPNLGGESMGLLSSTANYNGKLFSNKNCPYVVKMPISHELEPNEADRFLLNLNADKTAEFDVNIYLIYDGERKFVCDEKLSFFKYNGNIATND
jgi:hypothetical protein